MERLKLSHGVTVTWHAYELRPQGSPPLPEEYKQYIEAARPRLEAIAREHYGLELHPGPTGQSSRLAHIGGKVAAALGQSEAYHRVVLQGYWQEGQAIGNRDVLADLAVSAGLNRADFLAGLDDPQYDEAVTADVEQAFQYGLGGVPALIFAHKYLVSGAQPYTTLVQVTEKVLTQLQ
ncbi:MAG: DsbA family protein [Chloroflexi bacterium]|nr:DsbA family protein [Chloroflexota bacterium]MBP8055694.1 DsbA family protein [Chloroflexota bacterium]